MEKRDPSKRPFRFKAAWLSHSGFKDLLVNSWDAQLSTPEALQGLHQKLRKWNRKVFGQIQKRKDNLIGKIRSVQDHLELNQTDALLKEEEDLLKDFDAVLEQEEVMWFQKSREQKLVLGVRNTKFFHTSTIIRRQRNRIEMLKNEAGMWVAEWQELEKLAIDYYKRLYSMEDVETDVNRLPSEGFIDLTTV